MKIDVHHYELKAKNPINSKQSHSKRNGALLRVTDNEGQIGYADCHPWVEMGDEPLQRQLDLLKQGQFTPLMKQTINAANHDAIARPNKINLFEGLTIPQSHFLIPNIIHFQKEEIEQAILEGFRFFKVKLGHHLDVEFPKLMDLLSILKGNDCKARLDFNLKLNEITFMKLLHDLGYFIHIIDFYEDPFPFEPQAWGRFQSDYGISLACDHMNAQAIGNNEAAKVIVIKPAIQNYFQDDKKLSPNHQRMIFTSYLDHPVGQLFAAYVAAKANCQDVCGLVSHRAYEQNSFSEQLKIKNATLVTPPGHGIGFDDVLEGLTWKAMK